jgi:hypothetical protein
MGRNEFTNIGESRVILEEVKEKVKVKVSLCLTKHHAMKTYWGVEVYSSTAFLTSTLDGGEWSASRSGRFTPQGKSPYYPSGRRLVMAVLCCTKEGNSLFAA